MHRIPARTEGEKSQPNVNEIGVGRTCALAYHLEQVLFGEIHNSKIRDKIITCHNLGLLLYSYFLRLTSPF